MVLCVCGVYVCRSEGHLCLVFVFLPCESWECNSVVRLGGKHLYQLSHDISPASNPDLVSMWRLVPGRIVHPISKPIYFLVSWVEHPSLNSQRQL